MDTLQTLGTCTLYFKNSLMGNIVRCDVRELKIEEGKYAQYDKALRVTFTPRGKRKARGIWVTSYPFLVVLDSKDAFDPQSFFGQAEDSGNGVTVARSRFSAFDSGWVDEFMADLAQRGITPLYQRVSNERFL
jgi:hypothetical protein